MRYPSSRRLCRSTRSIGTASLNFRYVPHSFCLAGLKTPSTSSASRWFTIFFALFNFVLDCGIFTKRALKNPTVDSRGITASVTSILAKIHARPCSSSSARGLEQSVR
eukprot:1477330-Pyramimonas_sp.AAC.1